MHWQYLPASSLLREQTEVLVETELKRALIRLNKEIAEQPDRADEVIYKLRTILLSVNSIGLVRANEEFTRWMKGEMTMPFGKNYSQTPVRPAVSWLDGAHEIHNVYENAVPALFVPNILSFATDGKEFFYGTVRTTLEHWLPWRLEKENDTIDTLLGLQNIGEQMRNLLSPKTLLDILCNFSIFTNNKRRQRIKVVCCYQQYEGANLLVKRVKENKIKKD